MTVHELRAGLHGLVARHGARPARWSVTFLSFGFRHGLPLDADLVFDVRFLPNPHFVPALRPRTGRDRRGRPTSWSARATPRFLVKLDATCCSS